MSPQTYSGSCHCGAVKFIVPIDLEAGTFKCNCTICHKTRQWATFADPATFNLLQGEAELTKYTFNTNNFVHNFCQHCGVQVYCKGLVPGMGEMVMVQVQCLDDVEPKDLGEIPVKFIDMLHDDPTRAPEYTKYL